MASNYFTLRQHSRSERQLVDRAAGRNKLKAGRRLLVSPFPEIKLILSCCGVL
jgi:hypothetical protein